MTQTLLELISMMVFPGILSMLVVGLVAEIGAARALESASRGLWPAANSMLLSLRPGSGAPRALPPLAGSAILLSLLAVTQVAIPFNPLPGSDRNLLVAAMALVGAAWLTWTWGWQSGGTDPRLLLVVQGAWLVALLVPAVIPQNLRPQVLGAVLVPGLLPLKLTSAILYLLCLPALLQLMPGSAPQGLPGDASQGTPGLERAGFRVLRVLLWLPYCGLFASLYIPPPSDDAAGLVRFAATTWVAAAIAIALTSALNRRAAGRAGPLYVRVVGLFVLFTVAVAALTGLVEGHHS